MTDQDVPLDGGGNDAPLREPYDESMADLGTTEEEFENLPGWKRGRLVEMNDARRQAESERDELRGAKSQLEQRLAQFESQLTDLRSNGNSAKEPEPEGWAAFTTAKLDTYIRDEAKARRDFMLNPEDEGAKSTFLEFDPSHLQAVSDEKARRIATGLVDDIEKTRTDERAEDQRNVLFQRSLIDEYGPDIARPKSELAQVAVEELQQICQQQGLTTEQALADRGYQLLAVDRAHRKLHGNRGGRDEFARRHLAVEAGVRREAAPTNTIAALRNKGGWKDIDQAQDLEIGEFLKHNFSPENARR